MVTVVNPQTGEQREVCGGKLTSPEYKQRKTLVLNEKTGGIEEVYGICLRKPSSVNGRCRRHGANALKGSMHPQFIHGRYSKVLRRDVLKSYLASFEEQDLYSQTDEIALLKARIENLLENAMDAEFANSSISKLELLVSGLDRELGKDPKDRSEVSLDIIKEVASEVLKGLRDSKRAWNEIYEVMDHRRKIIESERKRQLDAQKFITEQQAQVFIATLLHLIKKNVDDPHVLNKIATEFDELARIPSNGIA